jgi:hypothetical protein
MIQEYKVVHAGTIPELEEKVNQWLEHGWKLLGGFAVGNSFYQSIYRELR